MQLRRGDVLGGAMAILDEYGLSDLTMRRLATSLGVQPGALYWHFPNKQTLLGAMADKILEDVDALPESRSDDSLIEWSERLVELAHRLRSALLAHRDGAELVSATYASRMTNSRVRESLASAAALSGISREHAELASYSLLYYVLGHTVDEQSHTQMIAAGALTRGTIAPGAPESPLAEYDEDLRDGDPSVRFDFGLTLFVDGIRARLKDAAPHS